MQHKSHKLGSPRGILYLLSCTLILLGALLFITNETGIYAQQNNTYPVDVIFVDNVTLPQVDALLAPMQPEVISQFRWRKDVGLQVYAGGLTHELGTDTLIATNAHWQHYIQLVSSMKNTIQRHMQRDKSTKGIVPLNRQKQYDDHIAEIDWIEKNITGCWDNNTCPPMQISRVTIMANDNLQNHLQASPLVASVDAVFPPTAFFFVKLWQKISTTSHQTPSN